MICEGLWLLYVQVDSPGGIELGIDYAYGFPFAMVCF
jgi:hypothetical protein